MVSLNGESIANVSRTTALQTLKKPSERVTVVALRESNTGQSRPQTSIVQVHHSFEDETAESWQHKPQNIDSQNTSPHNIYLSNADPQGTNIHDPRTLNTYMQNTSPNDTDLQDIGTQNVDSQSTTSQNTESYSDGFSNHQPEQENYLHNGHEMKNIIPPFNLTPPLIPQEEPDEDETEQKALLPQIDDNLTSKDTASTPLLQSLFPSEPMEQEVPLPQSFERKIDDNINIEAAETMESVAIDTNTYDSKHAVVMETVTMVTPSRVFEQALNTETRKPVAMESNSPSIDTVIDSMSSVHSATDTTIINERPVNQNAVAMEMTELDAAPRPMIGKRHETRPFVIEYEKKYRSFGLSTCLDDKGKLVVSEVSSFGLVGKDGNIQVGDHLVSINNVPLKGKSPQQVNKMLKTCPKGKVTIEAKASRRIQTRPISEDRIPLLEATSARASLAFSSNESLPEYNIPKPSETLQRTLAVLNTIDASTDEPLLEDHEETHLENETKFCEEREVNRGFRTGTTSTGQHDFVLLSPNQVTHSRDQGQIYPENRIQLLKEHDRNPQNDVKLFDVEKEDTQEFSGQDSGRPSTPKLKRQENINVETAGDKHCPLAKQELNLISQSSIDGLDVINTEAESLEGPPAAPPPPIPEECVEEDIPSLMMESALENELFVDDELSIIPPPMCDFDLDQDGIALSPPPLFGDEEEDMLPISHIPLEVKPPADFQVAPPSVFNDDLESFPPAPPPPRPEHNILVNNAHKADTPLRPPSLFCDESVTSSLPFSPKAEKRHVFKSSNSFDSDVDSLPSAPPPPNKSPSNKLSKALSPKLKQRKIVQPVSEDTAALPSTPLPPKALKLLGLSESTKTNRLSVTSPPPDDTESLPPPPPPPSMKRGVDHSTNHHTPARKLREDSDKHEHLLSPIDVLDDDLSSLPPPPPPPSRSHGLEKGISIPDRKATSHQPTSPDFQRPLSQSFQNVYATPIPHPQHDYSNQAGYQPSPTSSSHDVYQTPTPLSLQNVYEPPSKQVDFYPPFPPQDDISSDSFISSSEDHFSDHAQPADHMWESDLRNFRRMSVVGTHGAAPESIHDSSSTSSKEQELGFLEEMMCFEDSVNHNKAATSPWLRESRDSHGTSPQLDEHVTSSGYHVTSEKDKSLSSPSPGVPHFTGSKHHSTDSTKQIIKPKHPPPPLPVINSRKSNRAPPPPSKSSTTTAEQSDHDLCSEVDLVPYPSKKVDNERTQVGPPKPPRVNLDDYAEVIPQDLTKLTPENPNNEEDETDGYSEVLPKQVIHSSANENIVSPHEKEVDIQDFEGRYLPCHTLHDDGPQEKELSSPEKAVDLPKEDGNTVEEEKYIYATVIPKKYRSPPSSPEKKADDVPPPIPKKELKTPSSSKLPSFLKKKDHKKDTKEGSGLKSPQPPSASQEKKFGTWRQRFFRSKTDQSKAKEKKMKTLAKSPSTDDEATPSDRLLPSPPSPYKQSNPVVSPDEIKDAALQKRRMSHKRSRRKSSVFSPQSSVDYDSSGDYSDEGSWDSFDESIPEELPNEDEELPNEETPPESLPTDEKIPNEFGNYISYNENTPDEPPKDESGDTPYYETSYELPTDTRLLYERKDEDVTDGQYKQKEIPKPKPTIPKKPVRLLENTRSNTNGSKPPIAPKPKFLIPKNTPSEQGARDEKEPIYWNTSRNERPLPPSPYEIDNGALDQNHTIESDFAFLYNEPRDSLQESDDDFTPRPLPPLPNEIKNGTFDQNQATESDIVPVYNEPPQSTFDDLFFDNEDETEEVCPSTTSSLSMLQIPSNERLPSSPGANRSSSFSFSGQTEEPSTSTTPRPRYTRRRSSSLPHLYDVSDENADPPTLQDLINSRNEGTDVDEGVITVQVSYHKYPLNQIAL